MLSLRGGNKYEIFYIAKYIFFPIYNLAAKRSWPVKREMLCSK
jgi:hypothetical protein